MPFDLGHAARTLRKRYGDAIGFRQVLLDLLFAAGCSVREQAVALEYGDAVCVRTSGPAAPVGGPALVLVAVDVDPPTSLGLASIRPAAWPASLASLGGSAVALGWLAALHTLVGARGQRPWEVVFVRGPALGLADYLRGVLAALPADAEVVQIVPSLSGQLPWAAPLDLVRLELVRPRNIWRFPACDHTYALSADLPDGEALPRLRTLLGAQVAGAAWTLHDLHIQPGPSAHISAVVRSSVPMVGRGEFMLRELEAEQRLLFPVNDALAGLQQIAGQAVDGWGEALTAPLHAEVLPDGLCIHAVAPAGRDEADLPDRAGALGLAWRVEPLTRRAPAVEVGLGLGPSDVVGPVPAGAERAATLWRLPDLGGDDELPALGRALAHAIR